MSIFRSILAGATVLLSAAALVLTPLRALAEPAKYSLDELVVLDSFEGFGDVGSIDTSRAVTAPGDKLGFSVRFQFNCDPGAPVDWWSVHADLPAPVEGYDAVSFDIYKESADPQAALTISLAEADDNRWKLWDHALSDLPQGQWVHVTVPKSQMNVWRISKRDPDFDDITRLTIEPRAGKSVFYLDNVVLTGPGKQALSGIGTDDDGLMAYPWREPLQPALPEGAVLLPFDIVPASGDLDHATQIGLRNAIGCPLATPFAHYGPVALSLTRGLETAGIPAAWYSQIGNGYTKFFTKRQAWDVNANGQSLNVTPAMRSGWDYEHSIALGSPAVLEAAQRRIDALVRAGITTWVVPDYVFPYFDGQFGFSTVMEQAFRADLAGSGKKLTLRAKPVDVPLSFADYFRSYNGFFPTPQDMGLTSWAEFTPPAPDDQSDLAVRRRTLFLFLRDYEWLKLPDAIGRYAISRGAQPLWLILNGESSYVTPDYVYALRSRGVGNLLPECFGNAGLLAEAAYASFPYLRGEADHAGTRLSMNTETGAGGHSAPYWDWRIAYDAVYSIAASAKAQNLDNDFVDEATIDQMNDPSKGYQFTRYRDSVIKSWAFTNARAEKASTPDARILCITDRPVGRECDDIFDHMTTEFAFTLALSRSHFAFRVRDDLDLAKALAGAKVVFYAPRSPRVGDFAVLKSWLAAAPGRILVTHTFVPTRDARGYWGFDHSSKFGSSGGDTELGLGNIGATQVTHVQVTAGSGPWQDEFKTGYTADLPSPLTTAQVGDTLVDTAAGPLVSRVTQGQGQVIYLHFASRDPADPAVLDMNEKAVRAVARMADIAPLCDCDQYTSVQVFDVPGGQSVVSWNVPTLDAWHFEYTPGIAPLKYDAPGAMINIRYPIGSRGPALVYDVWDDKLSEVTPQDGYVWLSHPRTATALHYVGPDTPALRATIARVQASRARAEQAGFSKLP